jgi:hypothetical protein
MRRHLGSVDDRWWRHDGGGVLALYKHDIPLLSVAREGRVCARHREGWAHLGYLERTDLESIRNDLSSDWMFELERPPKLDDGADREAVTPQVDDDIIIIDREHRPCELALHGLGGLRALRRLWLR